MTTKPVEHPIRWRTALAIVALAVCATGADALTGGSSALAGTWMQVSCPDTIHGWAVSPGWSTFAGVQPGLGDGASAECSETQPMTALLSSGQPAHVYDAQGLEYEPPTGSTLDGGWMHLNATARGHGTGAYAEVAVFAPTLNTPFWSCAYAACPQGANNAFNGQVNIPAGTGGDLLVTTICNGSVDTAKCQEAESTGAWAKAEINEAHLLLSNDSVPSANTFGGSLLEPDARGTQELDLTATDPSGPGVYSATVEIEGAVAYTGTPNSNGGACVPTGTTNTGVMMFTSPQPCLASEALKLEVETTGVPDGRHPAKVTITDAARNTASVFVANITTHNAPVVSTSPAIIAANGVSTGVALSSTPGEWSAPEGAGSITDVYQWQRCSITGQECQTIPGATEATYTPTAPDAGHTLKLLATGENHDGQATAESEPTGTVAHTTREAATTPLSSEEPKQDPPVIVDEPGAPNGVNASTTATIESVPAQTVRRQFSKSALSIAGRLVSESGAPITGASVEVLSEIRGAAKSSTIGHVSTGANGAFEASIPPGPSRTMTFAYRAYANDTAYAAQATITETVSAEVQLHVTPRHTTTTGTIRITGRVRGVMPRGGITVALEVWYLGRWVPFRDPTTDGKGRFNVAYQFEGARGTFPFRVKVLSDQAGFPYTTGYSRKIDVVTR